MLSFHDCTPGAKSIVPDLAAHQLQPNVKWIDILNGTPEEIAYIERVLGRHIPDLAELSEIENSSRLRNSRDALYLSTPIVSRAQSGMPQTTAVGFILTKDFLITVRFADLTSFTAFAEDFSKEDFSHLGGPGAFAGLIEAAIDRVADVLESIGGELDQISQRVFIRDAIEAEHRRPAREDASLRETLRRIGSSGDLISKIRDSLLGFARIVSYVAGTKGEWLVAEIHSQLETQRHDIDSLADYDAHLSNKVQLLLDATMGLINIEQNNIIKVLTIVSVVGVPPTLIASMYGMNFRHMPELDWAWGYPYGLALIALSAILPIAWFKYRGWL